MSIWSRKEFVQLGEFFGDLCEMMKEGYNIKNNKNFIRYYNEHLKADNHTAYFLTFNVL